ncbi:MAG: E3 binding domain-containing protein, partial [Neisseriaceae bacterium]|nr:E3 binding domain-containing protein [Neisseriaceae bacterium]
MIIEIKVPALPESVSEATLMSWHKKVGEAVSREENLIDLETDKVVLELPSPDAGVITEILANDGDTVTAGQVIAKLDTAAAAATTAPAAAPAKAEEPAKTQAAAMPAAAKIAAENNVDLSQVKGSGRDGRILKEDVQAKPAAAPAPVVASTPAIQVVGDRPEQRVPMSRLRERVAQRLLQSQADNAILTTFNEVNMQPVMDLRNKYKEKFEKEHGVKLGFMS